MFKVARLNPIASIGTDLFTGKYEMTENLAEASAVLVRSASMHELELPDGLLAIARAGAGVNNIPLDECAKKGIVVFNAPGANANGVKEMVLAGMLLAARDIYGGITWIRENKDEADIAKLAEKAKKNFAGTEIQGKTLFISLTLSHFLLLISLNPHPNSISNISHTHNSPPYSFSF